MACTTILVGKKASYDGSTMIARTDDAPSGQYAPKKLKVVLPSEQPRKYRAVISHCEIDLPDNPLRYTCLPDALGNKGIWGGAGINSANVGMSATETITSNERVLGADPLVHPVPAKGRKGSKNYVPEQAGGVGEEDIITLVLPYIHSAREGVKRLGSILERYGTYEMNGIAFQDADEIWWLETIGGHHWMARRVPDDVYVTMPNQLGLDSFDLADALGKQKDHMCSADLREFIVENHLDLSLNGRFNPRDAFGSHSDMDHVYNTPRAWEIQRFLNPHSCTWDGAQAELRPHSDDIPWCRVPERKITVEDVKYALSLHYQGTPYDPYLRRGDERMKAAFRPIGINRTNQTALLQIRPYLPESCRSVEWLSFGCNVFNSFVPLFTNVNEVPAYLANTAADVSTDNFYWNNRLIAALSDPHFYQTAPLLNRYQQSVMASGHRLLAESEKKLGAAAPDSRETVLQLQQANQKIAEMLQVQTAQLLRDVLYEASCAMKNAYALSDA